MSVSTKSHVELLKTDYETAAGSRYALLKDRGWDETEIRKDKRLKFLKAKLKQMQRRLTAISQIKQQFEAVSRHKVEGTPVVSVKKGPSKKPKKPAAEEPNEE